MVIAGAALGAASGAASNAIDQHGNGKKFSWKSFAKDTIVGGVVEGVSGGVAAKAGPALKGIALKGIAQKVQGKTTALITSTKNFVSKYKINVAVHGPHHSWPHTAGINGKVWMRHIQIIVKTPQRLTRMQIPFGPKYLY